MKYQYIVNCRKSDYSELNRGSPEYIECMKCIPFYNNVHVSRTVCVLVLVPPCIHTENSTPFKKRSFMFHEL